MFLAFGEIMARIAPPGQLRWRQALPGAVNVTWGGGEANVCASLAMFGAQARYLTALPTTPIGRNPRLQAGPALTDRHPCSQPCPRTRARPTHEPTCARARQGLAVRASSSEHARAALMSCARRAGRTWNASVEGHLGGLEAKGGGRCDVRR